jgi:hypothetical protein
VGLSDRIVLVNGNVGLLERRPDGRLFAVIGATIANGRIAEMSILADPAATQPARSLGDRTPANVTSGGNR